MLLAGGSALARGLEAAVVRRPGASHPTQEWLATSDVGDARTSGYWHHQRRIEPHAAVRDPQFQEHLRDELARFTATHLV